tara:strand:+ start:3010 stop:3156 length:147 start_codon:yes stop_codon:yes gene_type:complete
MRTDFSIAATADIIYFNTEFKILISNKKGTAKLKNCEVLQSTYSTIST